MNCGFSFRPGRICDSVRAVVVPALCRRVFRTSRQNGAATAQGSAPNRRCALSTLVWNPACADLFACVLAQAGAQTGTRQHDEALEDIGVLLDVQAPAVYLPAWFFVFFVSIVHRGLVFWWVCPFCRVHVCINVKRQKTGSELRSMFTRSEGWQSPA